MILGLGTIEILLVLVSIAGGAFALWRFVLREDSEAVTPKATIHGIHPAAGPQGKRELPIKNGAVEWRFTGQNAPPSEEDGVLITLDPDLALGPGEYLADLSTGDVFLPRLGDQTGIDRIDGTVLFKQRRLNSQDIWLAIKESEAMRWMHLARYIPFVILAWIATIAALVGIVYLD